MIGRANTGFQPQQPQLPAGGFRQPQRRGLGGSVSQPIPQPQQSMAARPMQAAMTGGINMVRPAPQQRLQRGTAQRMSMSQHDEMTGVSRRQYANQPNAVEAARQQGSGLGGSLPQPKQYSNAPNIVNYTNRTYAAPQAQVSPVPSAPPQPVGGTAVPTQQQQQSPVAPPVTMPPQAPAALPGGPMNERDLREKEAMQ